LLVQETHFEGTEKIFPNAKQIFNWKMKMAKANTTVAMKMAKAKEKLSSRWQNLTFHELQKIHMM